MLSSILDESDADYDECLRLAIMPGGVAIGIDTEREGDQVFTFHDRKVLVVDLATSQQFARAAPGRGLRHDGVIGNSPIQ
jgi:hypothetical protein